MNLYGSDWNMIKLAGLFLALFGIAELLYHKARMRAEYTRKIVHVGTGLLTLLFPIVLDDFWQVVLLCGSFLLLLLASRRWGWLPSINAVERDTLGSILYPVIVAAVFAFNDYAWRAALHAGRPMPVIYFFWTPILIMAVCDPLAAAVGQRIAARSPARGAGKTWQGSAAFFAGALVLGSWLSWWKLSLGTEGIGLWVMRLLSLALATTLVERWSKRGWDNFTIPATAAAVLWAFEWMPA